MPGKKRTTTAKQSAISKRHKPSAASSSKASTSTSATSKPKPSHSAFPADKAPKQSAKKERKGKGPLYIPVVHQDSDDDSASEDGAMDIEEDLDGLENGFLMSLDEKGMTKSRPELVKEHRKDKPASTKSAKSTSLLAGIPLLPTGPLKSELRALKKKKNGGPALSDVEADSDVADEVATKRQKKERGELVEDLEEDDLAFGSGSSDDDLSVMSEFDSGADMSDMSDMSDLDSDEGSDLESSEADGHEGDIEEAKGTKKTKVSFDDTEKLEWESGSSASATPSVDDDESLPSDVDENDEDDEFSFTETFKPRPKKLVKPDDDTLEATYVAPPKPSKPRPSKLPTISNGQVHHDPQPLTRSPSPSRSPSPEPERKPGPEYRSDPLGQRFGRMAVRGLLEIKGKKERIQKAREEISDLGREASGTGEGEGGVNLLKRLLSLTGPKFSSSSSARSAGEKPVVIDREIRVMAMVSLLAVFVDIVPGYRIRPLTDAEKDVKVSQIVQRQREWEDGLVGVYKKFLEICEGEVTEDTPLAPAALHCLCQLVREKPDFNFAVNIMDVLVKRLGRKGWDDGHQMCLDAIVYLLSNDATTAATNSLHIVRLISRLVRARSFAIRPEVLSALLNLRLKEELGGGRVRASASAVYREKEGRKGVVRWNKEKDRKGRKGGKAKAAMSKSGSKKARVARKEKDAIDREMREAEGEINQEERERNMTETLKLLFALYFRIVKLDYRSPLLPAALEGLARFAHLVNVDFFRDLLEVLKGIIKRGEDVEGGAEDELDDDEVGRNATRRNDMREKLLCIVTAFELLQGQGEALNIDLGDFVSALYALVLPLALSPTFEEVPYVGRNAIAAMNKATAKLAQTEADLLFRALAAIFLVPRTLPSPIRTLAFSKRLLTSALQWPPASQLRTLSFLRSLLIREPKLEAMLETGDRRVDGKWKGVVDEPERAEPEGTCWWEASMFQHHPDPRVREEAKKLVSWVRE